MPWPWTKHRETLADRVAKALERGGIVIAELTIATRRGRVTLRGPVPSVMQQERAVELARCVPGVSDVDDRLTVVPPASAAVPELAPVLRERIYVVRPGDTLPDIAERLYGSHSRWRDLLKHNMQIVSHRDILQPGLRLRLPEE